jgi:hypothetical protein
VEIFGPLLPNRLQGKKKKERKKERVILKLQISSISTTKIRFTIIVKNPPIHCLRGKLQIEYNTPKLLPFQQKSDLQ